jgi:hypothetical protein
MRFRQLLLHIRNRAMAGRTFTAGDDRPAAAPVAPVAVISYHAWEQRCGLDPTVIGGTVNITALL